MGTFFVGKLEKRHLLRASALSGAGRNLLHAQANGDDASPCGAKIVFASAGHVRPYFCYNIHLKMKEAKDEHGVPGLGYPPELPICAHRKEILLAIRHSPVVVVCGDTGSGKTTQLPKMLLEMGYGAKGRRIACTQPRRLAAVTVATRVASEMSTPTGGLVGYRHRYGRQVSNETRIVFMTDGVLLAETRHDPLLKAYDAIIIDEAHERSLNVDFLLGILKRILARRPELKVIVSSATLDTDRFAAFFGNAPAVIVPGRLYPVEIGYRPPAEDEERDLPCEISAAVRELPPDSDILVFLPGERDIREAADHLARVQPNDEIIPLLASLPAGEQQRAFRLSSKRRIVLATNVAETSVTIPGIRCVIDSGLARIPRYIHRTQVQRLQIEPISQASARQRAGRCGRLGPGICLRLYSEEDFVRRDAYTPPEVLRSSLAGVILTMLDLRLGDIAKFPFLDPPKPVMVRDGFRELLELGAIGRDAAGEPALTHVGRKLAQIPVEPRLARMLLAASELATLPSALPVVAAMSCDDPRRRPVDEREKAMQAHAPFRVPGSDFLGTLKLWRWWTAETAALSQSKARALAKKTYLSYPKMREWRDLTHQLEQLCQRLKLDVTNDNGGADALHRALLTGLLGRLGTLDTETHDYRGAHGLRFAIHPSSVLAKRRKLQDEKQKANDKPKAGGKREQGADWVMAGELVDTSRLFARNAATIDPRWIEPAAGVICRHHCHSPEWDPATGFVRATEQVTLYGLVIVPARRCDYSRFDLGKAREIFIRRGLIDGDIPHPPPPVRENNALLDALRKLAEKTRQPELFDEDRIFAHFDRVIPPEVASVPALRKWLHAKMPPQFRLRKNDWWPQASATSRDFPETIRIGDARMSLTYRHTPDNETTDGITCTVRKRDAAALRLWRTDWLVPGALPEKLLWMLSVLPSAQRRILSPLADTVAGLMLHLKPGEEPLEDAVRRTVYAQWGIRIAPDAWNAQRIPAHLRVRFRIKDDTTGNILADSRDLDEALSAAGITRSSRTTSAPMAKHAAWDFGPLAEKVSGGQAGWQLEHYPALHDEGDGVTLQLYADLATATRVHSAGVTRLYLLALGEKAHIPLRNRDLPPAAVLRLKMMDYATEQLTGDILAGAVKETFVRNLPPVRDKDEFERRLANGRNARIEAQVEIGRLAIDALATAEGVSRRLETDVSIPEETIQDISTQLIWLVCRGFPRYVPLARLRHFARYLKGMAVRLDRARNSPAADRERIMRFAPFWQRYADTVTGKAKGPFDPDLLNDYRWLLEEYRISLFAQELRTAEPVSPKRLDSLWSSIMPT